MKKMLVSIALLAAISITSVHAQGGGGMTPEQREERMKKMKSELVEKTKITEDQATKVMEIQQASRAGMRGMRDMTPEDRQKKMDEMKVENDKKFAAIPLTPEQIKAVDLYLDEQQKKMWQGGNRPAGGGNQ